MSSVRRLGIALSVIGFAIAVTAGLILAVRFSRGETEMGGVIVSAAAVFIPVGLLVAAGIYLYVRQAPREEAEPESTMPQQREIVVWLNSQSQVRIADVARTMSIDVEQVERMVHELISLRVFSGYVNWQAGVLVRIDADRLRAMQRCQTCDSPLDLASNSGACSVCQTEYFLV